MRNPTPEFLLIDIGNTRVKWATTTNRNPTHLSGEIDTYNASSKFIALMARAYPKRPTIISSVVPKLAPAFRRAFSGRLAEVNATLPELGFHFHYPKPSEIGADRLAAAVAAHARGRFPAIIVACGTATAFTVLDAKGRLCGGAIAPGLQTQLAALLGATAQLPDTILQPPRTALAKSTRDAIRTGVMLNFQGGVKEIIRQLSDALPGRRKPQIILTGGNAHYLTGSLDLPHTLRPLLVFEGLRIIGNRIWIPES